MQYHLLQELLIILVTRVTQDHFHLFHSICNCIVTRVNHDQLHRQMLMILDFLKLDNRAIFQPLLHRYLHLWPGGGTAGAGEYRQGRWGGNEGVGGWEFQLILLYICLHRRP